MGAHPVLAGGTSAAREDSGDIGDGDDAHTETSGEGVGVEMELGDSNGEAAEETTAGYGRLAGVDEKEGNRSLQARNFRMMHAWLSRTLSSTLTSPDRITLLPPSAASSSSSPYLEIGADGTAAVEPAAGRDTQPLITSPSLLEMALENRDGGAAAAFMTLASMDPELAGGGGGGAMLHNNPIVLALRLYHGASTWRRLSRRPTPRQPGRGPGSRLHPNNPGMATVVNEADTRVREDRARADYESALALIQAGLAVSLADVGSEKGGSAKGRGGGSCDGMDKGKGGGGSGGEIDELAALAISEALTAAETRALAKGLGVSVPATSTATSERGAGGFGSRIWNGSGKSGKGSGGGGGGSSGQAANYGGKGGYERGRSDGKDEVCSAIEQWFSRPIDAAKRRARVARAAQQASRLIGTVRGSSGQGGGRGGGDTAGGREGVEGGVLVLRLADDAREAIHRIHVAFFAAARHGPHDAPALLREDLACVSFGGADAFGYATGVDERYGDKESPSLAEGLVSSINESMTTVRGADCSPAMLSDQTDQSRRHVACSVPRQAGVGVGCGEGCPHGGGKGTKGRCPPPAILSSVETFSEFYRLVVLADEMDLAASSGDSR